MVTERRHWLQVGFRHLFHDLSIIAPPPTAPGARRG